jgi:DNA-directed RNA polymerase specialized sigma24 family protein
MGTPRGSTTKAVKNASENGVSIEETSKITGKSMDALRSAASRLNIKLKTDRNRIGWGNLKQQLVSMDTKSYTAREVAEMLGTSIYTIYSMGARHNCLFKTAPYGSQKGVNYSIYGKTKK